MPKNLIGVGKSLSRAASLVSNQIIRERVSSSNRTDLFSFNLANSQRLNLKFRSTGSGTQINLIQDRNQDGLVEADEVVKRATMRPQKTGSILLDYASAGTYFIQVTKTGQGSSSYRLSLTTSGNTSGNAVSAPPADITNQIIALTNQFRQQNGLPPVSFNSRLTSAAQTHTQNMALQDFVSHTGADGSSSGQRVSATGYSWSVVAENIAAGYLTAADVVKGWIDSPGHRENLLNRDVTEIGVGYYFLPDDIGNQNWNYYWAQVFGTPQ